MKKKIQHYIYSPLVLTILWVVFLLSPLLSIFRRYYVVNSKFFNFHITGLSTIFLVFPIVVSFVVFIILVLWFKRSIDKKITEPQKKTMIFFSVSSLIFLIVARSLIIWEQGNYPNFLYQHLGLTIFQMELMSFVTALELFLFFFLVVFTQSFGKPKQEQKEIIKDQAGNEKYSSFLALAGLSILMILSIFTFVGWTYVYKGPKKGFESVLGVQYKYVYLLATHTPPDVKIIHPPQGEKWPATGNQPVLRYFLFPRTLISGALLNNQEFAQEIGSTYFVEIDPLSNITSWPKIDEKEKTIIFDQSTKIEYKVLEIVFKSVEGTVYKLDF